MRALVPMLACAALTMGCAVTTNVVRRQAAEDLRCPAETLSVRRSSGDRAVQQLVVSGCGQSARYVCSREGLLESKCTFLSYGDAPATAPK